MLVHTRTHARIHTHTQADQMSHTDMYIKKTSEQNLLLLMSALQDYNNTPLHLFLHSWESNDFSCCTSSLATQYFAIWIVDYSKAYPTIPNTHPYLAIWVVDYSKAIPNYFGIWVVDYSKAKPNYTYSYCQPPMIC